MQRSLQALAALAAALLWQGSAVAGGTHLHAAQPVAAYASPDKALVAERLDQWVVRGADQPDAALAALDRMDPAAHPAAEAQHLHPSPRQLLLARGLVLANATRGAQVDEVRQALLALAPAHPLAQADAALIQATLSDAQGEGKPVHEAAERALAIYQARCPADPGCDHRSPWRALMLLARSDERQGLLKTALDHVQAAADAARAAGDTLRLVVALGGAADLLAQLDEHGQAQRLLAQAARLARSDGTPELLSRLRMYESRVHTHLGDLPAARRAAEAGLALARQARAPRLQAVHLTNLSDLAVKTGRPQAALQAVQQALPLARQLGQRHIERTLNHNAALARVALGQTEAARQSLKHLMADYRQAAAPADETLALREFADAFASAGDLRTALDLYHQERELAARILAGNRDSALAELRERFDREAQQRQLQLLGRESSLMTTQLANRATLQKVWAASALVVLLAMTLVALLYKRVRAINRSLAHNHAFLRAQSQRDPLTGLANRRGLHEAAHSRGVDQVFSGALALVDIDHFKHVNDGHGHAAGDTVLVEVARRLSEVMRDDDVVARWGGEEFLIYMPGGGAPQAQALAERVLQAVGARPVQLASGQALRVTVSVGYGCFPLPPTRLPLTMERAINLADMALYTAKGQGRNRAIGVVAARVGDDQGLRATEADFDRAWHEGRLTLQRSLGPTAPTESAGSSQGAAQPA
jgi:diguanylate cyclase (GGDEF)-like protein